MINLSPMPNTINSDNLISIDNFVNHTIVTDANPPIVFAPAKFPAARGSRISRKPIHRTDNSVVNQFW